MSAFCFKPWILQSLVKYELQLIRKYLTHFLIKAETIRTNKMIEIWNSQRVLLMYRPQYNVVCLVLLYERPSRKLKWDSLSGSYLLMLTRQLVRMIPQVFCRSTCYSNSISEIVFLVGYGCIYLIVVLIRFSLSQFRHLFGF